MKCCKRIALGSALLGAIGLSPLAAGHHAAGHATAALTHSQMQALSSQGPTWHAGDGSIYDSGIYPPSSSRVASASRMPPASDGIILPDDATNELTPAEASRITGRVDSAAGPPLTGSEEQAGNMGPNSSKGQ